MILSLHELELAEKISDRILCVNGRAVDRIGTPEEVMTTGILHSYMASGWEAMMRPAAIWSWRHRKEHRRYS